MEKELLNSLNSELETLRTTVKESKELSEKSKRCLIGVYYNMSLKMIDIEKYQQERTGNE